MRAGEAEQVGAVRRVCQLEATVKRTGNVLELLDIDLEISRSERQRKQAKWTFSVRRTETPVDRRVDIDCDRVFFSVRIAHCSVAAGLNCV